jgi:type I restriction-modification system DNA methylase subunit
MTPQANERTFQGILFNLINEIIREDKNILFTNITQEEQVGKENSRFADGKLYSSKDAGNIVSFELKNSKWDATDEALVMDAMNKAFTNGFEYFVTGTPRQLAIFKTFTPHTTIYERKVKVYTISNLRNDDEVLTQNYKTALKPELKRFLTDLSNIVHKVKEIHWDSIDKYFVNKLSSYMLEATADMFEVMQPKINAEAKLKEKIKDYLKSQEIFNVTINFGSEDIYNICQLANYLLFLKIMFYTYLQRDVKELNLKKLEIPEDIGLLNKTLRQRFDDVLKHDYELIFTKTILDDFEFSPKYLPELKRNIVEIHHLNFKELNTEIIGSIYNTMIDNQEQHDRGQHFTNVDEVDIVNAFCINANTDKVLDSGCGAGTFLVRAYKYLKHYNANLKHTELLERLWGIEIAPFPAFLATMNLSLLDIKTLDNYPVIIESDFSNINGKSHPKLIFLNKSHNFKVKKLDGKHSEVEVPVFDACIGNPPYIRQEKIEHKDKWNELAQKEWNLEKINQQSDLYVYYLMHTASFLKDGGRLGYVISSSWLDVSYGGGLQKYLLDNFRIIAIIDNQIKRSFETASVNTVILILEKNNDCTKRDNNKVKFVRVFKEYTNIIGNSDDPARIDNVLDFVKNIESIDGTVITKEYTAFAVKQSDLKTDGIIDGKYKNSFWGAKYLRAPDIYYKIIGKSKNIMVPLSTVADVKYGIKTGANEFFYVLDDTKLVEAMSDEEYKLNFGESRSKHKVNWNSCGWYYSELTKRHYILERRFFKPLYKSQREAKNLGVDLKQLHYHVLLCSETKANLKKYNNKILGYILEAESKKYEIHKIPTCMGRVGKNKEWYDLSDAVTIGAFIFPSKIGERYRLIDNRTAGVCADKVNYNIIVKDPKQADALFLILNSIVFRYFIDLFSRQMVVKVSDVDVNLVERTLILNPDLINNRWDELKPIYKSLRAREQGTIFEEVTQEDRKKLDTIIFEELGLKAKDVDELYKAACDYVSERKEKSESVKTIKYKKALSYDDALALVKERFPEINSYNDLIKGFETKRVNVPAGKPKYPSDVKSGTSNLFGHYEVYFKDGTNTQTILKLDNVKQLQLLKWLHDLFDIQGTINLPKDEKACNDTLKVLTKDLDKNIKQIESFLKLNRCKAPGISIYKDLLF